MDATAPFRPRRGRNLYVHQSGESFYYRRAIPKDFRSAFGGKKEWWVLLSGRTAAERAAEAMAIADRHNQLLRDLLDPNFAPSWELRLPSIEPRTPGYRLRREGNWQEVGTFAVHADDDQASREAATNLGLLPVSTSEFTAQVELDRAVSAVAVAPDPEAREFAEFKLDKTTRAFDVRYAAPARRGPTLLSIMDNWRAHRRQAPTMWKKHVQYVDEFVALHGDLPLVEITKQHVLDFVAHSLTLRGPDGALLSPASIEKRLESVKAALNFAVSQNKLTASPAQGVKAPRDHRPQIARHWKALTKKDIQTLLTVSDAIWTSRRASRKAGRKEDLQTALRMLIWTGARPEEVCQLRITDVDLARRVVTITNDDSDDDEEAPRARLLKNERSVRVMPIHSRLLPTVAAHLAQLKARGSNSPLLFPSFEPEPTKSEIAEGERTGRPVEIKGRYSRPLSREWTDTLRDKVTDDPRKVLYSCRHAWAAESRKAGMPEHVRNALMGHTNDNSHADGYGGDVDWTEEKRSFLEQMDCVR